MSIFKRYGIFAFGILWQAAVISLVVKSLLGTSPISSVPYVLSLAFPYSLGEMTFGVNMLFLLGQLIILGKRFDPVQLMQIPITLVFAACIDLTMMLFTSLQPETYPLKFLLLLLGASLIALGVALQVIANVIMLAGEGIVNAISQRWKLDFGNVKTAFDTTLVITALAFSLLYLDSIEGIREGTLISALITGSIARFFIQHLSRVDTEGHLMLSLVLHPGKPAHPAASPCTKKE